jgi:hypothetical protein
MKDNHYYKCSTEIEIVQKIKVDDCIADEIQMLNREGVRTEGCCCGYLNCGAEQVSLNNYPSALIKPSSVNRAKELGYEPIYWDEVDLFEIRLKKSILKCLD